MWRRSSCSTRTAPSRPRHRTAGRRCACAPPCCSSDTHRLRRRDQASKREEPWKAARLNGGNSSRTRRIGSWAPFPIQGNAHAAIDELFQAGFGSEDIDLLHGKDNLHRLDRATQQASSHRFR